MPVYQESNGRWTAKFRYADKAGNQHQKKKRGFASEEAALAYEDKFKALLASPSGISFDAFLDEYLNDLKPRIRQGTCDTKSRIIDTKIRPFFTGKLLGEIRPLDLKRWQGWISKQTQKNGEPYSPTYLREINSQLNAIFNHARTAYGLANNPTKQVSLIGSAKGSEMAIWTKEEYMRFAEAISDKPRSYFAFEMLYWTGIREGEMLALTPADFDFEGLWLDINKSFSRREGQDVIGPPKTKKSRRRIAISKFLAQEMKEYIDVVLRIGPNDRIFASMTKHFLWHEMQRGCALSGVKRIRVHDLRHSHVSLLIHMGYSVIAIAERMGHESSDITFRYAHLLPNEQNRMADSLQSIKENWSGRH